MIALPAKKRNKNFSVLLPDLTPLLDVMFMLIIFFMLTANALPYAMDVELPTDAHEAIKAVEDTDHLSITLLSGSGGWKIGNQTYMEEKSFFSALEDKSKSYTTAIIIGDKSVSMEKLLSLMTFLQSRNISAADIVMRQG
jgi:biopolymer transport protein ExbD